VRLAGAELIERREVLAGTWLTAWHAPPVVAGARAGQYVHVRATEPGGLLRRIPYPIATTDASKGVLTLFTGAGGWAGSVRVGDRADLAGPLGRPFEVDPRSRHLLLVAEGTSIASLRLLVDEAVRGGRSVVLLYGAPSASGVFPSSLLPDEVEYVVATADGSLGHPGTVAELVGGYEAWADQAFAAGPPSLLAALAVQAAGRRQRLGVATLGRKRGGGRAPASGSTEARRKAFLQLAVDQAVGCAAGTCFGCAVEGTGGVPLRACREGPVFAADELASAEP
jgi:dihydroorotate dehydrogenase electron transfer subunit